MKLWLLKPINDKKGAWEPWYDKAFGFVIRATHEQEARKIASENAGCEKQLDNDPWLDANQSSCVPLLNRGEKGVVIKDFASA